MAVSRITRWRLMSVIFGIKCLFLMVTLGVLLINSFTIQNIQSTPSPTTTVEFQEVSECCVCLDKWVGHQCNCYFISKEEKSWKRSRDFCASQNSSLLQPQSRNELSFMNFSQTFFWIGMHYSEKRNAWLWEDGTVPSKDLFPEFSVIRPEHCIVYSPSKSVSAESCENKNRYICKKLPI
ncbi:natural killer cells antigen CD94 isoform X1 [Mus musculus]|uniref:Natural killer cells antigen CD94 n=1 Tax=Mus musculus TaxID=10090 RepID=KLRD1_MOUSE|nr:natural killer cells antigen CD94 [Mus musculus]XP_006505718.1 natural killer cells antigen CD94 isoform X1 [Mus musculus]O54707.1 RecName: Full=Natural killer cells antigen CD94; AltName: Full=Killer cell lectin-like receptor subfamily D member 1; AltName: CD_antigen=CD94 [Mus musculus]AAC28243.1 CD94 [Mus musculus]AAC33713.1 C-type lectin receptor [Mus musculus]AAD02116.1 CD94 antigen [Mus musculus]AAI17113.1 Killer cell lectin-like receptor, subfamily D, member 1 [Mus musculus]AAI20855|eukprot:NP_034784.1 natural killer cells antigen CD94 [Mus musculus]